jgi:hypothetical protein
MIDVEDLIAVFIIHIILVSINVAMSRSKYLIILHCQSYHVISPSPYLHVLGECIQFLVANRMDMLYELFSLVRTLIPFVNKSNQTSLL